MNLEKLEYEIRRINYILEKNFEIENLNITERLKILKIMIRLSKEELKNKWNKDSKEEILTENAFCNEAGETWNKYESQEKICYNNMCVYCKIPHYICVNGFTGGYISYLNLKYGNIKILELPIIEINKIRRLFREFIKLCKVKLMKNDKYG